MRFECPNCKKSGQVDDSKVPESGVYAVCPQCSNKFLVKREATKDFEFEPVESISQETSRPAITPQAHKNNISSIAASILEKATISTKGNPWRRYWARSIDTMLLALPVGYLFGLLFPGLTSSIVERSGGAVEATYPLAICVLPLVMLSEALILGSTGTTFGKWLLNITIVRKENGENITISEAIKRNFLLWIKGLAFGLPIICMIPMAMAANRINKNVTASWDDSISAEVHCASLKIWKVCLAVFSLLALLAINGILMSASNGSGTSPTRSPSAFIDPYASAPVTQTQGMKTYTITHPDTGRTIHMEGSRLPTEDEIKQAFAATAPSKLTSVDHDPFPKAAQPTTGFIIGNEVVTDSRTGLMWARNGNLTGQSMEWEAAMTWAANLHYAGYSDWRLPTSDELMVFSKLGGNRPYEWFNLNGFSNVKADHYWTSTKEKDKFIGIVDFRDVGVKRKGEIETYAWPVRAGR